MDSTLPNHPDSPENHSAGLPASTWGEALGGLIRDGVLSPPARPGPLAGLDRFEIRDELGDGAMGLVRLANDPQTGGAVAIKLLKPKYRDEPRTRERFLREARNLQKLDHPHILKVLEVVDRPEGPYFVMPFFADGTLARSLQPGVPLGQDRVLRIALPLADALAYAHEQGLIHRDVKPANILCRDDGEVCLADFGLSKAMRNESIHDPKQPPTYGTIPYLSPALANGKAEGSTCDIYSFGVVLYELLTGHLPYDARNDLPVYREQLNAGPPKPVLELCPKASPHLARICEHAMAREVRDRYASMGDVRSDLLRVQQGKKPLGPDQGQSSRTVQRMWHTSRPWAIGATVTLLVIGVLMVVGRGKRLWEGAEICATLSPAPRDLVLTSAPPVTCAQACRTLLSSPAPQGKILLRGRLNPRLPFDLWCIDPDGSNLVQLSDTLTDPRGAAWRVVSGRAPEIWATAVVTNHHNLVRLLSDGLARPLFVAGLNPSGVRISPAGDRVAFLSDIGIRKVLWVTDGLEVSGLHWFTSTVATTKDVVDLQAWLPDAAGLVMGHRPAGDKAGPLVAQALSLTTRRWSLYLDPTDFGHTALQDLAISPDGSRIAWVAGKVNGSSSYELYVARLANGRPDANTVVQLTTNRCYEATPVWSADGREIAFQRSFAENGTDTPVRVIVRKIEGAAQERLLTPDFESAAPLSWAAWGE